MPHVACRCAGPQRHLNVHGDNLGNVVQFMEREHRGRFERILARIAEKVPGIDRIDTERSSPTVACFSAVNDKGFDAPFYAQQVSDGTLKVFAYLLMLEDPQPPPFICNRRAGKRCLSQAARACSLRSFAVTPPDVETPPRFSSRLTSPISSTRLRPKRHGFWRRRRTASQSSAEAADDATVQAMADEGLPLGGLWYSDYLDQR